MAVHPNDALFQGERAFPVIPSCEHYAGSEKLMLKALAMQEADGPHFDVSCDCEDGAATGQEQAHALMVAELVRGPHNRFGRVGARIHDHSHPHWRADLDILIAGCGERLAYVTLPKATCAAQIREMIDYLQARVRQQGIAREIPVHVLIETHGALREVWQIAGLPWVRVLDFGLMDFVSAHHGAIPASAMHSPGQFEHALLARAKAEIVAAALAHGVIASHNVTLDIKNAEQTFADARRARRDFGFMRMWSVYPSQIGAITEAMKPDFSEVEDAAAILLAAQAANWGPIQYQNRLHDRATYRYYWQVLQRAQLSACPLPEPAQRAFFQSASNRSF